MLHVSAKLVSQATKALEKSVLNGCLQLMVSIVGISERLHFIHCEMSRPYTSIFAQNTGVLPLLVAVDCIIFSCLVQKAIVNTMVYSTKLGLSFCQMQLLTQVS